MKIFKKLYPIITLLLFISCNGQKTPCQDLINKIENRNINKFIYNNDNGSSYTPLGYAIKCGDLEVVKKLIDKGADINLAKSDDIYEYDALFVAIEEKNYSIVQYLLSKGADSNKIYTEDGLSPLSLSVINQNLEITKLLLEKKANVNGIGNYGGDYTIIPLKEALHRKNKNIVRLLLEYGANITTLEKEDLQLLNQYTNSSVRKQDEPTDLKGNYTLITKGDPIGDYEPNNVNYYFSFENNKAILSISSDNLNEIYCEGEYSTSEKEKNLYILKYSGKGICSSDEEINTLKIKIVEKDYYIQGGRFLNKGWLKLKKGE